jgi:hypothetical protein
MIEVQLRPTDTSVQTDQNEVLSKRTTMRGATGKYRNPIDRMVIGVRDRQPDIIPGERDVIIRGHLRPPNGLGVVEEVTATIVLLTRAIGRTVAIATEIPVGTNVGHRSPTRECVVEAADIPILATNRTTTAVGVKHQQVTIKRYRTKRSIADS